LELAIPLADIFDFDHRKRDYFAGSYALDSARAHKDTAELANSFSSRPTPNRLTP
jgi:hypothetical protein